MSDEKNVIELKELPSNEVRIFRPREFEEVKLPERVIKGIKDDPENIPVSVKIRPMSHREAELRKRYQAEVLRQGILSEKEVGITAEMADAMNTDAAKISKIECKASTLGLVEDELKRLIEVKPLITDAQTLAMELYGNCEDENKPLDDHINYLNDQLLVKHSDLFYKLQIKDMAGIYEAQDKLNDHSIKIVLENLESMAMKGKKCPEVVITPKNLDVIHPDLFQWILDQILERSYLTHGEVVGFR